MENWQIWLVEIYRTSIECGGLLPFMPTRFRHRYRRSMLLFSFLTLRLNSPSVYNFLSGYFIFNGTSIRRILFKILLNVFLNLLQSYEQIFKVIRGIGVQLIYFATLSKSTKVWIIVFLTSLYLIWTAIEKNEDFKIGSSDVYFNIFYVLTVVKFHRIFISNFVILENF